jgi:hypothetical protein
MNVPRATVAVALVAALAAGCSHILSGPDYSLNVSNGTTIPVTLVLNEKPISVIEPGNGMMIHSSDMPARPWTVELTTAAGRSLAELAVTEGSVVDERAFDGTGSYSAPAARADLSCGQVRVWVGQVMPGGPVPGPGVPGDCDP